MKKLLEKVKSFFKKAGSKISELLKKTKPFFNKIKAFFVKMKPLFNKIKAFFIKLKPFFDKIASFFKKYGPVICRVALCVAVAFFTVYTVIVITDTDEYISGFFERSAYITFDEDVERTEARIAENYTKLYGIASKLEFAGSREEVEAVISAEYNNLIYFAKDKAYKSGEEFTADNDGYSELFALARAGAQSCTEIYYDREEKRECIAFFIPVRGSEYIDGLAAVYPLNGIISLSDIRNESTGVLLVMDAAGNILSESTSESFKYTTGSSLRTLVETISLEEKAIEDIGEIIESAKRGNILIEDEETGYTISLSPIKGYGESLWLVNITENDGLLSPELEYLRHVVNIAAITVFALVVSVLYVIFYYKKRNTSDAGRVGIETPDGCPNKEVFRINATKLLANKERRYALSVFEIRQFRYISENITEKELSELLEYIAKVIQALCNIRESYGYLGDGKFGLLIHVESDRSIKDRIRLVESVAGKNASLGAGKTKRKFNIGISTTREGQRQSFVELLGYAEIACEKAKNNINVPYVVFNDEIKSERMHNEEIEAEMENALANNEFRLFLQPKYNVEADRIDSAEALVRWFDTKKGDYRFPGEFIGLFESNGFITKLDHFMYIETLKFLSSAAEKFDKIVPISVNVSMVTVSDPDFLDFYIENKKKYRVGDNFIVIEFTESFAMEDYAKIRSIVDTLHKNGIRCSLDDFGSGYSSLGTLKNIPFDELKFDRLFLSKGYDKKGDDAMLETMYRLASSLGIRVVQEGVETKEMFDSVVGKGCDVIQGYYYAKAIPVEEYKLFINSNTSIKYKSRVK